MTQAPLELYNYERQYRRRLRLMVIRGVLFLICIILVGILCYRMGLSISNITITSLNQQIAHLLDSKQTIEQQTQIVESLHPRIPRRETAQLLELLNARLSEGMSPERLNTVLNLIKNDRTCDVLQSKRFALSTPLVIPELTRISFFNGVIAVMGNGESFINEQGLPEAWFDPNQPVSMTIQRFDNQQIIVEGIVPLYYSVIIGDKEYRMTIIKDDNFKDLVTVTVKRCQFP